MRTVMMTLAALILCAAIGCNTMRSCVVVYVESTAPGCTGIPGDSKIRMEYRLEEIPPGSTVIVRPAAQQPQHP